MNTFHLTPKKLLGSVAFPPEWAAAQIAFVCFTPFPNGFKNYVKQVAQQRYFLHSPNTEVRLCQFENIPFIVISEVYGFEVGATTVEELVHYGFRHIIAVGYVGAFCGAPVGQPFIATETMSDLPLAAHYGINEFVQCKPTIDLYNLVNSCITDKKWGYYSVWTSNSIYRESQQIIQKMRKQGCDVVNMDTLSIYAVTPVCAQNAQRKVSCIYVGTVTDSKGVETEEWSSDLIEAVKRKTVHPHDELIKFMVEIVLPRLNT